MFNFFQPNVPQIDASDVKNALDEQKEIILLDVRTPEEYAQGHIQKSVLMPLNTLHKNVTSLTDKSKQLYVYCRSGSRSVQAVRILQQLGYTNVTNMKGGILSWSAKGYPIKR